MVDLAHFIEFLHVFAVIAWMAGMLYLPRLYVYHAGVLKGSESDQLLQVMERRLLRIIMNPAMLAVFLLGLTLAYMQGSFHGAIWLHVKLLLVLILAALHGFLAKCRKDFANGNNLRSPRFFRVINETITAILLVIVFLACTKPF